MKEELAEARRALQCLRLAAPLSAAEDVDKLQKAIWALIGAARREAEAERDLMVKRLAFLYDHGYIGNAHAPHAPSLLRAQTFEEQLEALDAIIEDEEEQIAAHAAKPKRTPEPWKSFTEEQRNEWAPKGPYSFVMDGDEEETWYTILGPGVVADTFPCTEEGALMASRYVAWLNWETSRK